MNGFEDDPHSQNYLNEITNKLNKKRRKSKCIFKVITNQNISDETKINNLLKLIGYSFNPYWHEVEYHEARKILDFVLSRSLAHNNLVMQEFHAKEITNMYFNIFGSAKYFTNGKFERENKIIKSLREYSSISESTFDSGIIAISNERIGIIWVEDED